MARIDPQQMLVARTNNGNYIYYLLNSYYELSLCFGIHYL